MNDDGLEIDKTQIKIMARAWNNVLLRNLVLTFELDIRLDTISRRSFSKMETLQIPSEASLTQQDLVGLIPVYIG